MAPVAAAFSDLREIVRYVEDKALSWIIDRRQSFNPLSHVNIQQIKLAIKASAELALVCALAEDNNALSHLSRYRQLADFLWNEIFQQEALQEYLLDNPSGLPTFSLYASLRQSGFEDESYRSRLKRILSDGYMQAVEAPPSAHMDFFHSLIAADLCVEDAKVRLEELFRSSLLAQHPSLFPLVKADVYTITHTLFFSTDFGRNSLHRFSVSDTKYLKHMVPRLLDFYLRRQNWDLSAELLIGVFLSDLCNVPAYHNGWQLLLTAQNADGSFTGPDLEEIHGCTPSTPSEMTKKEDAEWTLFRDNYHTTLAVLMALRVCRLDDGGIPDRTV